MPLKLTYALLLLLTLGLVIPVAVVVRKSLLDPSSPKPISTINTLKRGPIQIVRFTLYDAGICPQEARARQGMVTISIEDLSGDSSGLIVERVEPASHVATGRVSKVANRLRSQSELFLPEGRYEVAVADRPLNRALLIVEP